MARRTWSALVREGREAVEQEQNARWHLGDLAIEATSLGGPIEEYADAIGVPADTLEVYRLTSAAWAEEERYADVPWSIFRELAHKADRHDVLVEFIHAAPNPTVKAFRAFIGKAPNNYAKPTRESLIAAAREALADPEIAAEVVADVEVEKAAARAVVAARSERRAPGLSQEERDHLRELDDKAFREAENAFAGFKSEMGRLGIIVFDWPRVLRDIADAMAEVNACGTRWPEGWTEDVRASLDRIRAEADAHDSSVWGGVL